MRMIKCVPLCVAGLLLLGVLLPVTSTAQTTGPDSRLWYEQPADQWLAALPIGNGRMGGMVFGGVHQEHIQLNEETLWSGGPKETSNPNALQYLPEVRRLINEGKYTVADSVIQHMQGPFTQSYMPLGDLYLDFDAIGEYTDYSRELDIDRAVATTMFTANGVQYKREIIASFPDQVIVIRISADQPGEITFIARLTSLLRHQTSAEGIDQLIMKGRAPSLVEPNYRRDLPNGVRYDEGPLAEGMLFETHITAVNEGGAVSAWDGGLKVSGADAVTLIMSIGTSYNGFDKSPGREGKDPALSARRHLRVAARASWQELLSRHVADYQELYRRVKLDLGTITASGKPTDQRIKSFQATDDPALAALLFQYGRYLLIAGSRPGGIPVNLQGIWNDKIRPPWSSNYTININTEMNYWPAELTNLSECHEPLLNFIRNLSVNGRETASVNYGARGWVAHHNTDIWALSSPVGDYGEGQPKWANWPMGGGWLSEHIWEHYAFTGDRKYLREFAWPILKGTAEFCLDWLVEDESGYLVTSPSGSPEASFISPEGKPAGISKATTMDMAIIWEVFTNTIETTEILNIEPAFRKQLQQAKDRLYPPPLGSDGQLLEWFKEFEDQDPHHRHQSHVYGLHPGRQITKDGTPKLFEGVRKAMELRGDGGTGWSLAWKINIWARLLDGEHAYIFVRNLLRPAGGSVAGQRYASGLYPNMFDAHPPFQMDGNFGATSGIAEMLLQSHTDELNLLPALPSAWSEGSVSGLCARGGFEVDIAWTGGQMTRATVFSKLGGECKVRLGDETVTLKTKSGQTYTLNGNLQQQ